LRLSVAEHRDVESAIGVITTAVRHGVNLLDTAPSYGLGEWDVHHNERLVRLALESIGDEARDVRVATKVGLTREGAAWVPDGRTRSILASCEASAEVLGRRPLDLVLLHAVDPSTDLAVTARALAELVARGLAREVGACNVSLKELAVLRSEAPISAVQVAWSPYEQRAARGGVVGDCLERGDLLLVHSPFGGPKRAPRLARHPAREMAAERGISTHALLLALLYGQSERLVPLPGATRVETAIDAARAAAVTLDAEERRAAAELFGLVAPTAPRSARSPVAGSASGSEIVMVAGPQGAGKSTEAAKYVARGFERLNRDELGGTLAGLHRELDRRLRRGGRFVVDNTYLARADRHPVVELAARHRTPVRLVFCEAPSELLQARIARRMVESLGYLPGPDGLRALAKQHPFVFTPSVHFRALRALELADPAEGFESIEVARAQLPTPGAESGSGLESVAILWDTLVGRPTILDALLGRVSNLFVFAWCLPEDLQVVSRELGRLQERGVATGLCPHGGGPPICWCRPPMPGLLVEWAFARGVDLTRAWVIGRGPAHRALARGVGARFASPEDWRELLRPE
jgi:aryl-alcohol dehydrogenase-like predicted oxidoreductase